MIPNVNYLMKNCVAWMKKVLHGWQRFSLVRIKEIFMGELLFLEFHNGVKSFLWNQFQLSQWNIQTCQGLCATIENKTNDCQTILKIIQYIVINSPIQTSGMRLHKYRNTIAAISHAFQNYMIYLEFGLTVGI